ncbi:hypothetical protein [Spirillospora albida]|uniref:hypothetical protein n=1 Tax=Spirillospora albida TaxID=58123 RepID=UPI0004BF4FD7|nr:hypothetical protein [Spirillospora albida]
MIEALDALAGLADLVLQKARQSTDALTLAQTIKALEALTATVEVLHHLSVAMTGQATRLRDQEAAIQPDGQALCAMDTALVHLTLTCGQETMMTAHHLLASGRHELHTAAEARNSRERPDQGPPPPP